MTAHRLRLAAPAAFLLALALAPAPAVARAEGCPAFDPPTLSFDVAMAPLRHDHGRSVAQLASMPGRAPGPAGASNGHVLGLAHAKYGQQLQIGALYGPTRGGGFCGAISSLKVTFGFEERVVFIARELPKGSCIQREVLEHEMKHVATDEQLLKEYAPTLKRKLETMLGRMQTVQGRGKDQILAQLRRPIEVALKQSMEEFTRERDRRQAKVDTIQEYERVSRSCGGEVSKYVKGKGRF